eukprot:4071595-Amphidinium_carterae.1
MPCMKRKVVELVEDVWERLKGSTVRAGLTVFVVVVPLNADVCANPETGASQIKPHLEGKSTKKSMPVTQGLRPSLNFAGIADVL